MTEPNFSINFSAEMLAAEACDRGDLLVYHAGDGVWRVATTANRTAAGALSQAIALTAYGGSAVGRVSYKDTGIIPASLSGLGEALTQQLVRASATGQCERVESYSDGDDIVGVAEPDGRVHLIFGLYAIVGGDNLQGIPVSEDTPATGDLLQYDGTEWGPFTPPAGLATNGTNGQILTSDGAGSFGTPISPPAGSLVGTTATQELTNKTLTSPIVTGTPRYQGTKFDIRSVAGEVSTSSTSQTTLASYTMSDETLVAFDAFVTCARQTNVTKGGRYKRSVVYRRTSAGSPTIVGSIESGTDQETTSGDDVTFDVSSNDVRVRVTAADSDGRNWSCELRVQETRATT